jgi:diketogulonate reductase-like aldo/keto reductase
MQTIEANGATIPVIGLGTWSLRDRTCTRLVSEALRLGYRHVDTAAMYGNEAEVGEGVRASGVPRDEVFVVTKVWSSNLAPRDLETSAKASLSNLKLKSVDLLLIHWPNPRIPLPDTIGALCRMQTEGLARHVGISNFNPALVQQAVRHATVPLATNQIEWHPFLDQSKVRATCARHGLSVTAYSPIAKGDAARDKVLAAVGKRHNKSAAQVCLRFLIQEGGIVIPRTSKSERLAENFAVFDFALDAAEMDQIRKLAARGRRTDMAGTEWD